METNDPDPGDQFANELLPDGPAGNNQLDAVLHLAGYRVGHLFYV
jgi:hypothetical protein